LGGIGIGLKRKFVKQTKINSGFTHKGGFDQVTLIEAEPEEGAGCARILWKADAAVRQEQPRFDPSDCVLDQRFELLPLLVRNRRPEVLNFDQTLADENNLGQLRRCPSSTNSRRVADQVRKCRLALPDIVQT
jgi:hypothetical protein